MKHLKLYLWGISCTLNENGIFSVCAPPYGKHLPVTEHVPLHSKSLCKIIARVAGGANNLHPQSWGGGHKRKRSRKYYISSACDSKPNEERPNSRFDFCGNRLYPIWHRISTSAPNQQRVDLSPHECGRSVHAHWSIGRFQVLLLPHWFECPESELHSTVR